MVFWISLWAFYTEIALSFLACDIGPIQSPYKGMNIIKREKIQAMIIDTIVSTHPISAIAKDQWLPKQI